MLNWLRRLLDTGKRAIATLPWVAGGPRVSGPISADRAITLIPFFACVRILADSIAGLPLQTFRKLGDVRQQLTNDPALIAQPAARGTLFEWLQRCVISMAMRGNAYGLVITRDGFGFPTMIEWLHPDDVFVDETNPSMPIYYWQGKRMAPEDVVHIPWFVLPGRVVGLSPVTAFAQSIGVGLQAAQYGATWFANGGQPPGTFRNASRTVNPEESEQLANRLVQRMRSGEPLVFGTDWDYTPLQVTPEESQFIETMRMSATQIAAIFGIPPERVGGDTGSSLTYSTVEQNQLNFVTMTLRPWLIRLEQVFSALLPERQYVKFNIDALVRADLKTRYEAHHIALTDGWKTKDEVRELEDLPPLPKELANPPAPPALPAPPQLQPPAASGAPAPTNGNRPTVGATP